MSETGTSSSWIPESRSTQLWALGVVVPAIILIVGSLVRPDIFYDGFIWRYFYGPVKADATTGSCITRNGYEACPGYTLVSEGGYAYILIVAVFGVVKLLDHFDVGNSPKFFYGLFPYAFVGGALRVVEDTQSIEWPLNFFIISPVIYFVMFFITAGVFLVSISLEDKKLVDSYARPLGGFGIAWLFVLLSYLFYFGATGQQIGNTSRTAELTLWVPVVVLGLATVLCVALWYLANEFVPQVFAGTGLVGGMILWGHLVDGSATAIGIEMLGYGEKHPVVRAIIDISGTTYTFIAVKAFAAMLILSFFEEDAMEESPRFYYMLLVTILVVGLGPGTRDFLRSTIGV